MDKPVAAQIIDYLTKHPGSTNLDISKALNVDPNSIAARTSSMSHTGAIRKTPIQNRGMRGVRFTYEVGDPNASTTIRKAERDKMRQARAAKKKNGAHPNVITSKEQAKEIMDNAKALLQEKLELDEPDHSQQDQTTLRRAELLVRSGAPISDEEWATIAEIAGESRFDLESRWAPKPEVQERFEVKTPLPEVEIQPTTFQHPLMALMKQTADAMAAALMDQFQVSLMKQMSGLPGQLVSLPPPLKAVTPEDSRNPPSAAELAERIKPPEVTEKTSLPKVLVLGVKYPAQAGELQATFHDALDLRFWFNDEGIQVLKERARSVDHVVERISFISHEAEGMVKSVGRNPIKVSGGTSQLKEALLELATAPA